MKTELIPIYDSAKSFYHKAIVETDSNGDTTLFSYNTPIISIINGIVIKHWNGYSATTQRHINEFLRQNNCGDCIGKKWYTEQSVIDYPCAWNNL